MNQKNVIQKTRKVTGAIYSKTLHNLGAVLQKVRMVLMRKSKLSYIKKCVLEENLGGGGGGEAALLRDSGPFRAYTRHRSNA